MSHFTAISNKECPCRGCVDRFVGCHSKCLRYIDWKQKHELKLEHIHEQKSINNLLYHNQNQRNKQVKQQGGIKYGRRGNDTRSCSYMS